MALKEFLKSKVFLKNLLLIVASFVVLVFIVSFILRIYTRHGQEYEVPNIVGLNFKDIESNEKLSHFEVIVIDSIHKDGVVAGTILNQDPTEGAMVKDGRKIYITISSYSGEMMRMPSCTDKSLSRAVSTLTDAGLRVGTIMYRDGEINNIVVAQRYQGKNISVGSDIMSGEKVDLIVEVTSTTQQVVIPNIVGKTEADAEVMLWKAGLNVGRKITQGKDNGGQNRVVSFSPSTHSAMIGTAINLNLMDDSGRGYKKEVEDFEQNRQIEEEIQSSDTVLVTPEEE